MRIPFITTERRLLWVLTGLTALILFAACAVKYHLFLYNAIDLAYFNQVLWNTVHGRPFVQSIHPHLSLGDHAEFILLLLALPYALIRHPLTLLALQAIAVTAPALVLYRLAEARYGNKPPFGVAPLFLAIAWLANASIHGIALFEFHALAFALLPLMLALLAYERGSLRMFLLWSVVAMLVREDVSLVVAAVGVLAVVEKKPLAWRVAPIVLGATWFIGAMAIIAQFAPGGDYKFAAYYGWLRTTNPLEFIGHVITLGNVEMVLAFLIPLTFLPVLAPRRLILLLGPLAQIILGAAGGGALVAETHYATLFLPGLFLASIDGLEKAPAIGKWLAKKYGGEEWRLVPSLSILLCAAYGALILGPLPSVFARTMDAEVRNRAAAARDTLSIITPEDAVAASYALLPALSSRESLYAAHYIFLGVTQFGEKPYPAPADLRKTTLDQRDFQDYAVQFPSTAWAAPRYEGGSARLASAIGPSVYASGPFSVHDLDAEPVDRAAREPLAGPKGSVWRTNEPIGFIRASAWKEEKSATTHLRIDASLSAPAVADQVSMHLEFLDARGKTIARETRPLIALAPLPQEGARLEVGYDIRLPQAHKEIVSLRATLVRERSVYGLDSARSATRIITKTETLDQVSLPLSH